MTIRRAYPSSSSIVDNEYLESKEFQWSGGFPSSESDFLWFSDEETAFYFPEKGSIVRAFLRSSTDRAAGVLTSEIYINGSKISTTLLDCKLDDTVGNNDLKEIQKNIVTFQKNDRLEVLLTSSSDWSPNTSNIVTIVWFTLDFS